MIAIRTRAAGAVMAAAALAAVAPPGLGGSRARVPVAIHPGELAGSELAADSLSGGLLLVAGDGSPGDSRDRLETRDLVREAYGRIAAGEIGEGIGLHVRAGRRLDRVRRRVLAHGTDRDIEDLDFWIGCVLGNDAGMMSFAVANLESAARDGVPVPGNTVRFRERIRRRVAAGLLSFFPGDDPDPVRRTARAFRHVRRACRLADRRVEWVVGDGGP